MNDIINKCSQSVLTDEQGAACFAIAERVVNALIKHGLHISFAESCTGGLAAAHIVDVPNASYVLDASFVTYANQAKVKFVNVAEESIAEHGVVSECVALSMAKGAAAAANAEIGVGISGIAGPSGGSPEKPVGTVCFGFYFGGKAEKFDEVYTENFGSGTCKIASLCSCKTGSHGLCRIRRSQRAEVNAIARSSISPPAEKPPHAILS